MTRLREWTRALLPVGAFLAACMIGALILTSFVGLANGRSDAVKDTKTVRASAQRRIDGLLCDLDRANRDKADLAARLADAAARNEALATQLDRAGLDATVSPPAPPPPVTAVVAGCSR